MTIFGKILVFVNLVFALIVGGLLMVDFMVRTNWEDGFNKQKAQLSAVIADRDQTRTDLEQAKTDYLKSSKEASDALASMRLERDAAQRKAATAEASLATILQKERKGIADVTETLAASKARHEQVEKLLQDFETLRQEKLAEIEAKNAERRARIEADVASKTFKSRNLELESQIREMARELVRSKAGPAGTVVSRKKGEENPPADNVEGQIVTVDNEDNLVKLSIGSDAGLVPGHTLKVFRLHPIPEQSRYLGVIEILQVRPLESVGRPLKPMSTTMRPGDRVASSLFGGK